MKLSNKNYFFLSAFWQTANFWFFSEHFENQTSTQACPCIFRKISSNDQNTNGCYMQCFSHSVNIIVRSQHKILFTDHQNHWNRLCFQLLLKCNCIWSTDVCFDFLVFNANSGINLCYLVEELRYFSSGFLKDYLRLTNVFIVRIMGTYWNIWNGVVLPIPASHKP